ncbi:MAG: TerC family protein [Planctomycetes bacterium]|nr:TerC family protein [Planctomycetota bacterium]
MEWLTDPQAWIALLTLTFLETVLGIDNIVFVSILTGRLPVEQQARARRLGLLMAMGMRIALLFTISWIMRATEPLFAPFGHELSVRDLILLGGGLFLMWKSVTEIHHKLEGPAEADTTGARAVTFGGVLVQIALLDLVFSLDSVITAVGMVQHIAIMVIAVLISVGIMVAFVNPICAFVERHPTVKMLALSFLLLIGFTLVGEAWELHIPKGYVYFAMGFSIFVEMLNLKLRKSGKPVVLHGPGAPKAG